MLCGQLQNDATNRPGLRLDYPGGVPRTSTGRRWEADEQAKKDSQTDDWPRKVVVGRMPLSGSHSISRRINELITNPRHGSWSSHPRISSDRPADRFRLSTPTLGIH